uniref:Uncharacterized protein n=1 Tax=Lepeophtheirus salmonis TaxID=72036 RepID=A0A0K2TEI3_LEPSM
MNNTRCCCQSLNFELKEASQSEEILGLQLQITSLSNTLSLYQKENVKFVDSLVRCAKEKADLELKLLRTEKTHEFRRVRALKKAEDIHKLILAQELKKAEETYKSLLVQELKKAQTTLELPRIRVLKEIEQIHNLRRVKELKKAEEAHKSVLVEELKKSENNYELRLIQELKKAEETHKSLQAQEIKKAWRTHKLIRVEELKKAEKAHESLRALQQKRTLETYESLQAEVIKRVEESYKSLRIQMETEKMNYSKKLEAKDMEIKKLLKASRPQPLMELNRLMVVDQLKTTADEKYKLKNSLKLLEDMRKSNETLFLTTIHDLQIINFEKDKMIMELRNELKMGTSTIFDSAFLTLKFNSEDLSTDLRRN